MVFFSSASVLANERHPAEDAAELIRILIHEKEDTSAYFKAIEDNWQDSMIPMVLETWRFSHLPETARRLITLLREKTGQPLIHQRTDWMVWLWNQPENKHPAYAQFKGIIYSFLDKRFAKYFGLEPKTKIRLDEIVWGGVSQDGIPPLRQPTMIAADQADYLAEDNVVFGIEINGDARAYPKRILAWHEMFIDEIGGTKFAGVYCTLCGAVILYETVHNGVEHHMGTSGFLYRSNKLMYDQTTQSLWNSTWGEPVVGPLVDQGIRLKRSYLVTTTWGEWKKRHPDTTVLAINTGFQRDYSEGAAYRNYFAIDDLMFNVPKTDNRLANKDEVVALVFPDSPDSQLAISAKFLTGNPFYQDQLGTTSFVVLTDTSGANRVYNNTASAEKHEFVSYNGANIVNDANGMRWTMSEAELVAEDGTTLQRLPSHRAFWFGWYAAYPKTRLVY
ncbi:MAG: hypothetical protein ACI8P9_002457 [Parasphingorhabdus sp.]|jgi:hypothetical protein